MPPSSSETLNWRGNAPVSEEFDDVYYSADNGLEETRFVFLQGIGAPEAWQGKDHFVIAETGFGTGLNFLATWQAWKKSGAKGRLTFISVEGYPLSEAALKDAHETFPELTDYAAQLRAAWPPASEGFHPRFFENGQINLILMFGDVANCYATLSATIDAWYLDGFAPAKNPAMWSEAVMDQIARLSRPGTRFATFTAAGFVRRALQERGFDVEKSPGYGRKRERLVGVAHSPARLASTNLGTNLPEWATFPAPRPGRTLVIGGGIAGTSIAAALQRRGRDVAIISSKARPAASHVPAAILSPRFMREHNAAARFFTSSYALSCWLPAFADAWAETSGVHVLPKNDDDRARLEAIAQQLSWGEDWLQPLTDGFFLPRGGSLSTDTALAAMAKGIEHISFDVEGLIATDGGWRLTGSSVTDRFLEADNIIVAGGIGTLALIDQIDCPELRPNRGQVERLAGLTTRDLPAESLAYGGYLTAEIAGLRTLGSTFDRMASYTGDPVLPSTEDQACILKTANEIGMLALETSQVTGSWAGLRATTADHLPFAGPVARGADMAKRYAPLAKDAKLSGFGAPEFFPGLYMLGGMGSKGYQYAPLAAEFLAAQICGDPSPLPTDLIAPLHPARDIIRTIKRTP